MAEIRDLVRNPPDGITYHDNDENTISEIYAIISGPEETPFYGGKFKMKLVLSEDYPNSPPRGFFLTKIYHPNVANNGDICVNTLKKDWDPTNWSFKHVFEIIRCLLIVPFPESALNEEAGKEFMEDYEEYSRHARLITELYAIPKEKQIHQDKSKTMDISFENSQKDSPTKSFSTSMASNNDSHAIKEKDIEFCASSTFKSERPDDVLMPVTNSLNTNPLSSFSDSMFKKSEIQSMGSFQGMGMIQNISNPASNASENAAAKKGDDKKKWRKRI